VIVPGFAHEFLKNQGHAFLILQPLSIFIASHSSPCFANNPIGEESEPGCRNSVPIDVLPDAGDFGCLQAHQGG
jgi:hypothetical protein